MATLVIMAAGMGSRYGGLKQIDPIGPHGEMLIDYSVYDAIKAGFSKIVFIIKEEIQDDFVKAVGERIEQQIETKYVFQEVSKVPDGVMIPDNRVKPWGTGHAVLCCKEVIDEPFAVINSDDYYGQTAFDIIHNYLVHAEDTEYFDYCMAGYHVENTLTENGTVSRGVCETNSDSLLTTITERKRIARIDGTVQFIDEDDSCVAIDEGTIVSMNCWGFTPSILTVLEEQFKEFAQQSDLARAEFFLPSVVDRLIHQNKAVVNVLTTPDKWFGVTYKEDKLKVENAVKQMICEGKYPERLWGNGK